MFCPVCRDEFRPGFTHCVSCDVDLVERLAPEPVREVMVEGAVADSLVDYCGFLAIHDAREAVAALARYGVPSKIAVREAPGEADDGGVDEYWLQVPAQTFAVCQRILGYERSAPRDGGPSEQRFDCSECGESVGAAESFCPHCGARFDS